MDFFLVTVRLWSFIIKAVFGDEALIGRKHLLEGGVYFDLIVK